MKNILEMTRFTLREAMAKKVFMFYLAFSVLSLIILGIVLSFVNVEQALIMPDNQPALMNATAALQIILSGTLGTLLIFLAVFSSANFISSMLEKGTADLFLSKPISRDQLLWGKFAGGTLVFIINILLPVIGSLIIISLKFGYINYNFLWVIATFTLAFMVLYSIVVLLGVATRSSFGGIMTAYFIFIVVSQLLLLGYRNIDTITENSLLQVLVKGLYHILPKTSELTGEITNNLIMGMPIENYQPILTSFLFLIFMMIFSTILFRKKDF
jgi:ABC-type transport system involved in multi-copper enzyme maturation permease subunit